MFLFFGVQSNLLALETQYRLDSQTTLFRIRRGNKGRLVVFVVASYRNGIIVVFVLIFIKTVGLSQYPVGSGWHKFHLDDTSSIIAIHAVITRRRHCGASVHGLGRRNDHVRTTLSTGSRRGRAVVVVHGGGTIVNFRGFVSGSCATGYSFPQGRDETGWL